jgi:propanol-preferring alcohol dehydrogenase
MSTMRAMVLHGVGRPLLLKQVPMPKIGPNDVLVKLNAVGIGLTVVHMVATPGVVTAYPRIPGHEGAGTVVATGAEVRTLKVGQRVTNHFYLTCGQCRYCRSGRETLCVNFRGNVGMGCDGAYAQYMALPERNCVPIPDGVSDIDAAVASDAIATPYHACYKEAEIGPGDDVLVFGAGGGVGVHMVQMARLCGGRVIGVDLGEARLSLAKAHGADAVIDGGRGDILRQVQDLTGGRGVDAAIDVVGASATLKASFDVLARGGRMVVVGVRPPAVFGEAPVFPVDAIQVVRRGIEIHGSRYVTATEIAQTLEILRQGRLKAVVSHVGRLEDIESIHQMLRDNAIPGRAAAVIS